MKKKKPRKQRTSAEEATFDQRRNDVMHLLLNEGLTQVQIAKRLKISQPTVSRDIAMIRGEWRSERVAKLDDVKGQENEELRHMETLCAQRFAKKPHPNWIRERVRIKERRAKMFGLDKPIQIGGSLNVKPDLSGLSDADLAIAEALARKLAGAA